MSGTGIEREGAGCPPGCAAGQKRGLRGSACFQGHCDAGHWREAGLPLCRPIQHHSGIKTRMCYFISLRGFFAQVLPKGSLVSTPV